ncbi:hypothetical protein TVAG_108910 [Trichomonas vaginalis G3]|uniref:Ubiquitin-like protease family profile domain-containing protein n=1 Tax=Trichomonas vaginalis (strain ATCC PRA-98 / G3) TaxID=412133 RepID=A2F032_TRIV3|nr:protease family [Trichomonas vaginalis G3]EAY01734.1 hypothetical protein TVAG_108910 [Trichomonas vaginalis G3]KAI5532798.1 protease family [Trichomonas vaginalis G3]|eukprot:XP_001314292.1 hypothetical protein [Trichomonas vaginalis G3]
MKNKFLHFDSLKNMNLVPAKKFSDKIAEAFNIKNYKFKNMKSPLQNNDKDCGVYLMAIMDEIASTRKISDNLRNKITPDYIKKFRIALMTCITQSKANYNWETYYKMLVE